MTTTERPAYEYVRPWLYPQQERALFAPQRYSLIEASTKSGKTVAALVWLTEQAMRGIAGRNYWWVAPIYGQADIAFRRLKAMLPRDVFTASEGKLTITLANRSIIWFKGSENPDSLYGEDVYAAVIDEASRVKEESWFAVRSTLTATRGPVRIIGNVKGRKNWFYQMARKAEANEPDMAYHQITAYDAIKAGVLDKSEIEDAKRQLPEQVFRELYLAEPSDDGGNPFGIEAIRACIGPRSEAKAAVWGWDLAKSVDWTVGIGLDRAGVVAVNGFHRWQAPWPETVERIKQHASKVPALLDSTGVGDPVLDMVQKDGGSQFEGWKFTPASKQQLMDGLRVAIQSQSVHYPDGPIVSELESFEYKYTGKDGRYTGVRYSAPEGMHDDCVMALALVVQHYSMRRVKPGPAITEPVLLGPVC